MLRAVVLFTVSLSSLLGGYLKKEKPEYLILLLLIFLCALHVSIVANLLTAIFFMLCNC